MRTREKVKAEKDYIENKHDSKESLELIKKTPIKA